MARAGQDGLTRIVLPPGARGRPACIRAVPGIYTRRTHDGHRHAARPTESPLPITPGRAASDTESRALISGETSIYYYLQRAFATGHTFIRMQTGRESIGLTGAQRETNVTASVRHCDFINGRTGARTRASASLELAAGSYGEPRRLAAERGTQPRFHAAGAAWRLARRYREQCASTPRGASGRFDAPSLTWATDTTCECRVVSGTDRELTTTLISEKIGEPPRLTPVSLSAISTAWQ